MKDGLGTEAIDRIAVALCKITEGRFPGKAFRVQAEDGLGPLALKQRVIHIISVLRTCLPDSFEASLAILSQLPQVWDRGDPNDPLRGFAMWPLTDIVAEYGLDMPEQSLPVLRRLTPLFTAEFAIRPFIIAHPIVTMQHLLQWQRDPCEAVRRLVSEGTRPLLPWGMQLKEYRRDPSAILPLLEALRMDDSEYVRRSVANNLNDISKDHPLKVIEVCSTWKQRDSGQSDWVIKHGVRTLVKQGLPEVFPLLGFAPNPKVMVDDLHVDQDVVHVGEALTFSFSLVNVTDKTLSFVVDFAVHYRKANGTLSPKVFKLKNTTIAEHQNLQLEKRVSFKKVTTRTYYAGEHVIAIHINGVEKARHTFLLESANAA